ncbi:MAG TPA: tRNA (adenosine(37)-N6)-threonylcarbamoyltransferase complex ATPase subunit type 1 TsaE [Verrucomicrobiae bacterium]|nr:tRNA (adenosine(37)-N6)-threonylcarbamoyltransferase complex ATPase subunit type 1 TsaE [Verrucomicrobiae bacterium]
MPTLKNLTETRVKKLASDLAKEYKEQDIVIGLSGQLGAGKTTFAKSFATELGVKKVKSPTFIVVSEYKLKDKRFYHIDFYRLTHLDQLQSLGLTDLLHSKKRIVLIEWVDKFPEIREACDIIIKFKIKKNLRDVQINYP